MPRDVLLVLVRQLEGGQTDQRPEVARKPVVGDPVVLKEASFQGPKGRRSLEERSIPSLVLPNTSRVCIAALRLLCVLSFFSCPTPGLP